MNRWWLVLIGTAIGALLGAMVSLVTGESYKADVLLIVAPHEPENNVEDEFGVAVAKLATRVNVVGRALKEAGFDELADEPGDAITSRGSVESPSLSLTATADDAGEAAKIANVAAVALEEFTRERSARTGFRAAILGPAGTPSQEADLGFGLAALAGAALGFSLSLLLVLARLPE